MTIDQYIQNINQRYKLGNATEHTFRGDLQQLLESPTVTDLKSVPFKCAFAMHPKHCSKYGHLKWRHFALPFQTFFCACLSFQTK